MVRNPELKRLGKQLTKAITARRKAEATGSGNLAALRFEESQIKAAMRRITCHE